MTDATSKAPPTAADALDVRSDPSASSDLNARPDPRTAPPRPLRQPAHPDITEALIEELIRAFYAKVRGDAELGPVFAAEIGEDWEPHLAKMFDFWSSVTRMTGRYRGKPTAVHQRLSSVKPEHFLRWLALFRETARDICAPEVAPIFIERAERIGESLQLAMFFDPKHPERILPLRETPA